MDFHSYRHIDAVWPFFVLAANYFTYQGFEKRDLKLFLVSGVCLGVAFLIKEVAILFFPLPLLMFLWIAEYRKREILKGVAANILVAIIVVGPWLFYLWQYDSLASLIGGAAPEVVKDIVQPIDNGDKGDLVGYMQACLSAIKEYGAGLARYYSGGRSSLHSNFLIAPGFLLAWLFMLFKAGKGDRHSKILVLNSLLFLPILYYVGKNDFRLGQTVLFLLLSYLALTTLLQWAFERVSALTIDTAKFRHALFCIAVVCLLSIQVLAEARRDLGYKGFIDRSLLLTLVKGEQVTWRVRGTFGDELLKEAIQEIQRLTSVNDGIMVSWYTHARTSYFGLAGKHPVSRMPLLFCHEDGIFFDRKRNYENEKPLWINSNYIPFTLNYMLFMLFESDLLEEIEKKNVKYVLLTPKLCQLNDYFYRSSSFEEISAVGPEKKPRKMYRLYRVEGYDKLEQSFSPVFTKKFRKTMEKLQSHDKKRYEYFRDKYIYDLASISPYEFSDCDSDSR